MKRPSQNQLSLPIVAICLAALMLRAGLAWVEWDNLKRDPDAYLGIAEGLARGQGFHMPGRPQPTAYRPPLYPLVLSLCIRSGAATAGIALMHIVAGVMTVALTAEIARRLGLGRFAYLAALAVAVDPLLVQYTAQVMTETMFTFLVAVLVFLIVWIGTRNDFGLAVLHGSAESTPLPVNHRSLRVRFVLGVVFGLCALCRPTVWVCGALVAASWAYRALRTRRGLRDYCTEGWPVALAAALTVAPWPVRNAIVLGRPIVTTTHGGYTLLLGNNPVFYREVVAKPWGTVWGEASLTRWQQSLNDEMARESPPVVGEIARDRWMRERAIENIRREPAMFIRACGLRLVRFWNIVPQGSALASLPQAVVGGIGTFFGALLVAAAIGVLRLRGGELRQWGPLLILVFSLTLLHTIYWSNARMRAPLVPVVALLAARGVRMGRHRPTPRPGHDFDCSKTP